MLDFQPNTYQDWLQQIEKDLKGKPWSDLQWHLDEGIVMEPFYHPDQYFPQRLPLLEGPSKRNWAISESIPVYDPKQANQEILQSLEGGVEALTLELYQALSSEEWAILLSLVKLEYISLNLQVDQTVENPAILVRNFQDYLHKQGLGQKKLQGYIDLSKVIPAQAILPESLSGFRNVVVDGTVFHQGHNNSARELAAVLKTGEALLANAAEDNRAAVASNLLFKMAVSKSFFVEIAKLRALRILWFNVLKAYGLSEPDLFIAAYFAPDTQDENTHTNMVRAATQAMSAIIGGAKELYILPANVGAGENPTAFTRRIARNVQHILRLESYLDKVQDPAAGSFYIEKLTEELAKKAWAIFQQ